jgi:hypothetical protein
MIDDRICIHYVVDRLEDILELHDPQNPEISDMKYVHQALEKFKEECIYNLGVNVRIKHTADDLVADLPPIDPPRKRGRKKNV